MEAPDPWKPPTHGRDIAHARGRRQFILLLFIGSVMRYKVATGGASEKSLP
jgi:hypothetical protein